MARQNTTLGGAAESVVSRVAPTRVGRAARTLDQSRITFGVMASAFAISAIYQAYRGTIMQIPEDAFTAAGAAVYAAEVGVAALVLTDRRWAWWLVSAQVILNLAVGPFYYFPVVAMKRDMGLIDWLEATAYVGMLSVAGSVCALRLLGASVAPKKGWR